MSDDLLYFNGINGDTGSYDLPPMSAEELMSVIRGEETPDNIRELRYRAQQGTVAVMGVREGIDPTRLDQAGWGVIFAQHPVTEEGAQQEVDAIREALQPLLRLRQEQAGDRFAEWTQGTGKGFRVGADSKSSYLARHGIGPGPADPDVVPYYLLIVGSPADIPFRFQTQLDVQYAVGRIHFETPDEYAAYAANVVAVETSRARLARRAAFFGVANPDDPATQLSYARLVQPLTEKMQADHPEWAVDAIEPAEATKATLASLLGGERTPSLLFTASHGMNFANGSPRQLPHQGALLCQDWPGPEEWAREIPQDFYFAGDDLTDGADLLGLLAFFFACYGGGTPQYSDFVEQDRPGRTPATPPEIAPHPFLARLPMRMLGRPRGALAAVGHVERAWSYSFDWGKAGAQTAVFESTLERLLKGHPIGSAIEYFNERYAELSTVLTDELGEIVHFGRTYDPLEMAGLWTANNDARGYAIIGDPAVRLPVVAGAEPVGGRGAIEVTIPAPQPEGAPPSPAEPAAGEPAGEAAAEAVGFATGDRFQARLRQTEARYAEREAARQEARAKLEAGQVLEADTPERVARRLARLEIDPAAAQGLAAEGVSFATISAAGGGEPVLLERILGTSDLMGVAFLELGLLIARTVGRVHCRSRSGETLGYGTGFLVSPRLMMTNNHVLDSADRAAHSQIEFDYQIGLDGKPAPSVFFDLAPDDFFLTDEGLDYTLVAVQPRGADGHEVAAYGWNRLYEEEGKVITGECLNIIQHPNGEPKQLALRENRLEDALEAWLHYHTDTAPGSSGSPVFNDQWEVVALHHSGVPRRDEEGQILARDGQVWRRWMGEQRIDWMANEGARVSRIVRHVKDQPLAPEAARLRDEMLDRDPMAELRARARGGGEAAQPAPAPASGAGQAVTVTIPLEVTVRVTPPEGVTADVTVRMGES